MNRVEIVPGQESSSFTVYENETLTIETLRPSILIESDYWNGGVLVTSGKPELTPTGSVSGVDGRV